MDLSSPLPQLLLRGTAIYFLVVVVVRILPKRSLGNNSPVDMLALVIVGALVADAMSVGSEAPSDFVLLAAVVAAWSYVINLLEFRFPSISRLTDEAPRVIVRDGRMLHREMRKELITEDELIACVRRGGLNDIGDVACATVETTGEITLLARDDSQGQSTTRTNSRSSKS